MMSAPDDETRDLSFWHATAPPLESLKESAPLSEDIDVDIAVVGAGFTGLWAAYYLKNLDPSLSIAMVEANSPGFGASGRNGGWCLGLLAGMHDLLQDPDKRDSAIRLQREMFATVDEIRSVTKKEGIDCHWAKGGMINFASTQSQREEVQWEVEHWRKFGFNEEDFQWLEPDECAKRIHLRQQLGGSFSPHCAAIHPLRLVFGLVDTLQNMGVALYAKTPALDIDEGTVFTPGGKVRAKIVVLATEAYSGSIRSERRKILPFHSLMIATEKLPPEAWLEIGLAERETFGDPRRTVIFGQRTQDDRFAFGARSQYFFGSKIQSRFSPDKTVFRKIKQTLDDLFPVVSQFEITHRWGGAVGIPRSWSPRVGIDPKAGLAWAGGYVGEGVAASNLAGRTLADLILERDSALTDLPWVGGGFERWEREPLRWLGIQAMGYLGSALDHIEFSGKRSPRLLDSLYEWLVRR